MAAYINLEKPLATQVLKNQKVKYEALSTICFFCKKYGHTKELCIVIQPKPRPVNQTASDDQTVSEKGEDTIAYRPWMVLERKSWQNSWNNVPIRTENKEKGKLGSRFGTLANMECVADLGKEQDKRDKGKVTDSQGKLMDADFGKKQKISFRDNPKVNKSSRLGGAILENGLSKVIIAYPDINGQVVGSALRAADSDNGERAEDPSMTNMIQANHLAGPKCPDLDTTYSEFF
ncbi:hypothetical protein J1N35_037892 [Gossypium stocksii]|uniref:DUF4283 domain-containing protein n=1 Tax=Gossypium stocksii TaxID=47602 RepID=A0A9D3UL50_9ROSI|nr:hypothetical protein J1N35_037892 [Gossypium stocksii]